MSPEARGFFAVPAPVRSLFNTFPLTIYDPEPLPYRSPSADRPRPALYVFALDGHHDRPSYNPSCLKWQTFLRIAGVEVDIVPSNNHASPSGALPFLLLSSGIQTLTGERIRTFARQHATREIPTVISTRLDAYHALLDQSVRPAWLYALYLDSSNAALLAKLYLPSSPMLSLPINHTLKTAATAEILKTTRKTLLLPEQLYAEARNAFEALETLLGDDEWFFGTQTPGLFDAAVFAYTWLILDDTLGWRGDELQRCLGEFGALLQHRERLYQRCWGKGNL